jgi:membrane-bound lytic murein transglycosylase B
VLGFLATGLVFAGADESLTEDYGSRSEVQAFIDQLVRNQGFDRLELLQLFANVRRQSRVLDAITRPAETKPWHEYRSIFLTPERISRGVEFWNRNEDSLARAEHVYGVPPEIVVAIIGVETFYGRDTGRFPVLDTLTTLGFDYPPRSKFFRSELEHFLLLAREESLDLVNVKGSYAGAMGQGQFIPSSYRKYAVDFDNDGKRDLWSSTADVVGSVANYFKRHGWKTGSQIALPVTLKGTGYQKLLNRGLKPSIKPHTLKWHGVTPQHGQLNSGNVTFLEFEIKYGKRHWIGFDNFYVITRYNHSPLYAMAVYQLSQQIKQNREHRISQSPS